MTKRKMSKKEPARPAGRRWSARRIAFAALGVALFTWLLYVPSLRGAFVWDDVILIGNPDIRTLDGPTVKRLFTTNFWDASDPTSGMYRPVTTLSYYVDYHVYGAHPAGFHQTNIILNAAVSAMVFVVLLEMYAQPLLALIAALWFAAFPIHVESVAWISGRTDIVATLLALISLWFYARWRNRKGAGNALLSLFCYGLALLGKEVAIVLPGVVVAYELTSQAVDARPQRAANRWLVLVGMIVLSGAYFVVRRIVAVGALPRFTHGVPQAVALTLSLIAHHTYKLIFPFRLSPTADFPPPQKFLNVHTLIGLVVVALVVASVIKWRRNRAFVFGIAVIACGSAPVLHIVPANATFAEHFLYFPSLGWAFLVSLAITHLVERRRRLAVGAFAVVWLACCAQTVMGTLVWRDDLTLFKRAVAMAESNPTAHFDLGVALAERSQFKEAVAELQRATELDPTYADAWSALGRAVDKLGRHDLGLQYCARAVELQPKDARFLNDLGTMQFTARHYAEAAATFRRVIEVRPRHWYAHFNLGLALYQQSDFEGAIREFSAIPNKDQDFPNAWFFLADCQMRMGNKAEAMESATHFLSIHTDDDAIAAQARKIAAGLMLN